MTCRLLPGEIFVKQDVLYLAFPIPGKWIEIFAVLTFTRLNLSQFWTQNLLPCSDLMRGTP